jgi:hypothetical protein
MKNNLLLVSVNVLITMSLPLFFAACSKDKGDSKGTRTYTIYTPVYKSKANALATINGSAAEPIEHTGKIYLKDNFIYLNEVNKGIHVIDNSNNAKPKQVAFLAIPGNLDIAIKGNILYADMYSDLLALDISDIHHAKITSTIPNFFTSRIYVNGHIAVQDDKVAVEWKQKDTTVDETYYNCDFCQFDMNPLALQSSSAKGVAGSMAGMVLMDDYLYAITEMHSVGIVDVSNAASPILDSQFFAGFDLQTIFPFEGKLFLGSAIGMFMYDVTNAKHPTALGEFSHGRACDPVITDGKYAYVTLHAGATCGGNNNELHVIDVKNLQQSKLVKTYQLTKPTGLSKDGNLLFICDDTEVKVYNAAEPSALHLVQRIKSKEPYDVIAGNNKAIVVCRDGLYQYSYSNINSIRLMSFLSTKK